MKDMSRQGFLVSYSIQSVQDKPEVRTGVVVDISCPESYSILNEVSTTTQENIITYL